jgi:hypothetical protein
MIERPAHEKQEKKLNWLSFTTARPISVKHAHFDEIGQRFENPARDLAGQLVVGKDPADIESRERNKRIPEISATPPTTSERVPSSFSFGFLGHGEK